MSHLESESAEFEQLQPYQQRVVKEKEARDGELARLEEFLDGDPDIDPMDRSLLEVQQSVMTALSRVLAMRIARF